MFISFLFILCQQSAHADHNFIPSAGVVPNEHVAIQIAVAILSEIYGPSNSSTPTPQSRKSLTYQATDSSLNIIQNSDFSDQLGAALARRLRNCIDRGPIDH